MTTFMLVQASKLAHTAHIEEATLAHRGSQRLVQQVRKLQAEAEAKEAATALVKAESEKIEVRWPPTGTSPTLKLRPFPIQSGFRHTTAICEGGMPVLE